MSISSEEIEIGSQHVSKIQPPQKPRPTPNFVFTDQSSIDETYESYAKNGFETLEKAERVYNFEKRFISQVDLTKGPILVTVQNIVRAMVPDMTNPKRPRREQMTYTTQWEAKNHRNQVIRYIHEHQGKHQEQTKQIQTRRHSNGEEYDIYVKGVPIDVYTIPWDKKKAEDLIKNEKVFGEDTINITLPQEVNCVVKFLTGNIGRTKFDLDDFLNLSYEKLQEASKTNESPYLAELRRKTRPYG